VPAATTFLTVAEFETIADPREGRYELHHGELVLVPPPKKLHARVQKNIFNRLLRELDPNRYEVYVEVAFRPAPEYEVWVADLAAVAIERWAGTGDNEWLTGAPELVIEVLSPSNTAIEMNERQFICLRTGTRVFWEVDPQHKTIKATTVDGQVRIYTEADEIALDMFGGGIVQVSELFA
jgi:Uma2 family endonuclease